MIGHGRCCARRTRELPRMDELRRRLHLEEFALENIWLASGNARRPPAAAFADVPGPFPRVENARPDPPVDDLFRSERSENALRRCGDLDRRQNLSFGEVRERLCGATLDLGHFSSRLRFNWVRLDCQNDLYPSSQPATLCSGSGLTLYTRSRPTRRSATRRASRKTRRCFEIAGLLDRKSAASAPAFAGPARNRSRIARRVGSAMARKTSSEAFARCMICTRMVTYHSKRRPSTTLAQCEACPPLAVPRWRKDAHLTTYICDS